jgi:L-lactate dehydrogenase complex protein LldE
MTTPAPASPQPARQPRVGLFVTCLVDAMRPSVGFAAAKLLEDAGCRVEVPRQTCCGQPAFNSGDRATARAIATQVIDAFSGYDYVVAPSGSCAGMIRAHFPELFADDPNLAGRAAALAEKWHDAQSRVRAPPRETRRTPSIYIVRTTRAPSMSRKLARRGGGWGL